MGVNNIFLNIDGFRIVVHKAAEGGYWGEVPALPGCASQGATVAECRANVAEAAEGCLDVYFEEALKKISGARSTPRRSRVHA